MRRILPVVGVAGVAALALVGAQAGAANASTRVLTTGVLAPFHLSVDNGTVYAADGGLNKVIKVDASGTVRNVASGPTPGEVAGVWVGDHGKTVAWTQTSYATGSALAKVRTNGKVVSGSTSKLETKTNPDGHVWYGMDNPNGCQQRALKTLGAPAKYQGDVNPHPYDITKVGDGWVIAEAGGNDLLKMDAKGKLSVLTVLPPQAFTFTPDMVSSLGLPSCMDYATYKFDPVPTSVTTAPDGMLYVTTLPGGPESPAFGARGSVLKVNPHTGATSLVATGFLGATDVTVSPKGDIYVAELFGGKITRIGSWGNRSTVTELPGVVSVEYSDGHLYAGQMAPTDEQGNPVPGKTGAIVRVW